MRLTHTLLLAAALVAIASPAWAQDGATKDFSSIALPLARFNAGMPRERYIADVLGDLRRWDRDGRGLQAAELDEAALRDRAARRAANLSRIYAYDLNDDGRVERSEIQRGLGRNGEGMQSDSPDAAPRREKQIDEIMKADSNGDGVIDFREARADNRPGDSDSNTRRGRDLLALDPNKDGVLTAAELETLARKAFALVDADGDGLISYAEYQAYDSAIRPLRRADDLERRLACDFPKPSNAQQFIVVSSPAGQGLSTVTVAGQDEVTSVSRIEIEPGPQPLFLLLVTDAARIWTFQGATERVARVVVAAPRAAGVVGIAREKIIFEPAGKCLVSAGGGGDETAATKAALLRMIGREPDKAVGGQPFWIAKLPSWTLVEPSNELPVFRTEIARLTWHDLTRFFKAGIAHIDAKTVISPAQVEPYGVLPQQAGLIQLMNEGSLIYIGRPNKVGGVIMGGGSGAFLRGDQSFQVTRPIKRFPAGLIYVTELTFVLSPGVPVPPGNVGRACVISEETHQPLTSPASCKEFLARPR